LNLIPFDAHIKTLGWSQAHLLSGITIDVRIRFFCLRVEACDESMRIEEFQNLRVNEHLLDFHRGHTVGQVGNDAEAQGQNSPHHR